MMLCSSVSAILFLSTPSARRATAAKGQGNIHVQISIHALREEGDRKQQKQQRLKNISIHALREEGDAQHPDTAISPKISIHALREEGDQNMGHGQHHHSNFYPRPPRGGRLCMPCACWLCPRISIHALREEGDQAPQTRKEQAKYFYPRPPRGGRPADGYLFSDQYGFLSTPSARRATAKTETKSLFSNKLYNILHEFRRALIYNGSKNYPNHAKRLENPVRRCRKDAEDSPFAPGRKTQNNSRPSCSKGG